MKKLVACFLVTILMFNFSIQISAFEMTNEIDVDKVVEQVEFNEWDKYTEIINMTDEELKELGVDQEEIEQIRSFDYEEEIRARANLDDDTLKSYGYSDEEIIQLREASQLEVIPEAIMQSISSSTMTTKLEYLSNGSTTQSGSTMYYVNMKFSWEWERIPLFRLIDMVVVAFGSSTGDAFTYYALSSNKVHATYDSLSVNSSDISQDVSWVYSTSSANSISAKFGLGIVDSNNNLTHFAFDGYGIFRLTNRSNNARLYIDTAYGHTTISVTPSYSLSGSGLSLGIDFGFAMDEQHCTGYFYENFEIGIGYIYYGTVKGKNGTGGTV